MRKMIWASAVLAVCLGVFIACEQEVQQPKVNEWPGSNSELKAMIDPNEMETGDLYLPPKFLGQVEIDATNATMEVSFGSQYSYYWIGGDGSLTEVNGGGGSISFTCGCIVNRMNSTSKRCVPSVNYNTRRGTCLRPWSCQTCDLERVDSPTSSTNPTRGGGFVDWKAGVSFAKYTDELAAPFDGMLEIPEVKQAYEDFMDAEGLLHRDVDVDKDAVMVVNVMGRGVYVWVPEGFKGGALGPYVYGEDDKKCTCPAGMDDTCTASDIGGGRVDCKGVCTKPDGTEVSCVMHPEFFNPPYKLIDYTY